MFFYALCLCLVFLGGARRKRTTWMTSQTEIYVMLMKVIQTYADNNRGKLYVGVVAMCKDIKEQLACGVLKKISVGNTPIILAYTRNARNERSIEPNVSRVLLAVQKSFKSLGGWESGSLVSLWCRESSNSLFCLKPKSYLSVQPRFKSCTECPCNLYILFRGKQPSMLLMRSDVPDKCISIFPYIKFTDMERQISFVGKKDFTTHFTACSALDCCCCCCWWGHCLNAISVSDTHSSVSNW